MRKQEIFLRPEQKDFVTRIYEEWGRRRAVLGVYPTGGGKTFCFSSIVREHPSALVVAHRKKIIIQISKHLALFGVRHRIIAPDHVARVARRVHLKAFGRSFVDPSALHGVGSVQTLTSKSAESNRRLRHWLSGVKLAVFDEGHHYVGSGQWSKAVTAVPDSARLLFVTATPERCDGKGLAAGAGGFVEALVEGPPVKWQIENGRLCKYRYLAPSTDLDVSDIPITSSGDFNRNAFRARVVESSLVGDVVRHYEKFAAGLKTIVFATDVQTAKDMEAEFRSRGHNARELNATTDISKADKTLEDYERGAVDVLINVDLFDEGFDVPDTEVAILARPTMSLGKFLQQVGRVLRTAEGKERAIIIDCVRNWERHGLPDWPRVWSLEGKKKAVTEESGPDKLKICIGCTQPFRAYLKACPYCGDTNAPKARNKPEAVDGDLYELDVEALSSLFGAMGRADMPEEDYRRELIRSGCPMVGVPRNVRVHKAAKYRRDVLRTLVSWWVGAQAGRDPGEIHRRFYHRFGIDIGTAFTLKAGPTDELIERISKRYVEDLI